MTLAQFTHLFAHVSGADAKPTQAAHDVFGELDDRLNRQMADVARSLVRPETVKPRRIALSHHRPQHFVETNGCSGLREPGSIERPSLHVPVAYPRFLGL